jgi:hypothetical protein|tara:strand:+ start:469 stop:795 length:327 start_codon:yes stop_codon:yes gene_type:complete
MAVTKALNAIPYSSDDKVEKWNVSATYENDSKGDATYYKSTFSVDVEAIDSRGNEIFTKKSQDSWTKEEIEDLMPIEHWDTVFASQVDSVITNPVVEPSPDRSFTMPE